MCPCQETDQRTLNYCQSRQHSEPVEQRLEQTVGFDEVGIAQGECCADQVQDLEGQEEKQGELDDGRTKYVATKLTTDVFVKLASVVEASPVEAVCRK